MNAGHQGKIRICRVALLLAMCMLGNLIGLAHAQIDQLSFQCFDVPKIYADIVDDPVYTDDCLPEGKRCDRPLPPVIDQGFPEPIQSETAVIKATKPDGYGADYVVWRAEYQDPQSGVITQWEHESREWVQPTLDPYDVFFGAPGLHAGGIHYLRVAYCSEDSPGGRLCTCYSKSVQVNTTSYAGDPPASPFAQEVEDHFRRIDTQKRNVGGDGFGPQAVWLEVTAGGSVPFGHGSIVDQEEIEAEAGTQGIYTARGATHSHSYAEVRYRRDPSAPPSQDEYNVDVLARVHMDGNLRRMYVIKLANDIPNVDASLVIARSEGNGETTNVTVETATLASLGPSCSDQVPLKDDPATPVWLRVEVDDEEPSGNPVLTATAAWGGCTDNDAVSDCTVQCTLGPVVDDDPALPQSFRNQKGNWGFWGHHQTYRVDSFRAGSEQP